MSRRIQLFSESEIIERTNEIYESVLPRMGKVTLRRFAELLEANIAINRIYMDNSLEQRQYDQVVGGNLALRAILTRIEQILGEREGAS